MSQHFDLVILGSGSTAFAAALRAAEMGKTVAMTESRTLGGTCVNRGCLPSKNLIEAARIVWEAAHPRYPGLQPARMEFDFKRLVRQKDDVIRSYRDRKYRSLVAASDRIAVFEGHAAFLDDRTIQVEDRVLRGDHLMIATGSRSSIPPIEGLDRVPHVTSDLLSEDGGTTLDDLPESMVILGSGYIALELGQMFHRFGTRVTILERSRRILPRYEPEVSRELTRVLRDEGIDLVAGVEVFRVEQGDDGSVVVHGRAGGTERRFRAQRLMVAAGRVPNTAGIGIERAGVEMDWCECVQVDDELRTNVPHIWAAGDVIGSHAMSQMATPVGAHDGSIVAVNAFGGQRRKADHRVVPRAIFTDPQVAVVGLTDAEARHRGHRCWCNTVPVALVPRAGAVHDTHGIAKIVVDDDTHEVLGVSLVMRGASEVIHEAAMALRFRARLEDFIDLIHVYPTMAEALKLAAISYYRDPAKLSCCAE